MRSRRLIASVVLCMLAAVPGGAQTAKSLLVTVPFQFSVHDQVLPAGAYMISQVGPGGQPVFAVQSSDDGTAVYALGIATSRNGGSTPGSVAFHRHGNSYFLADIWWGGGFISGIDVCESKTEKELAKTASLRRPDQVVLLASR